MKTRNSRTVGPQEKCRATEAVTPKLANLHSDAVMSGIMTRSRLKQLSTTKNKELCESTQLLRGNSKSLTDVRCALLRYFEDSPGTTILPSSSTSSQESQSPRHEKKESKAVKSKERSLSLLNKNEQPVIVVSEHTYKSGSESDMGKLHQESDEDSVRRTELLDGPSLSSTNDELCTDNSRKERKVKKARKSKSSPPPRNRNGSTVPTAPEHITELQNEMCKVKVTQKYKRCKDMLNPFVSISPLQLEFEECKQLGSNRCGKTPFKNSSDLEPDTNCEVDAPLSGLEPLDWPLISSDNNESSANYSAKERKAKKSRKQNSSSSNRNERSVSAVSEHITAFENKIGVIKSWQGSDKCSLKSTEHLDGLSVTSDDDKSFTNRSQKKSKLQNSIKCKLPAPNESECTVPTVPDITAAMENEICMMTCPRQFDKCKNEGNPIITVPELTTELEVCVKSDVCIRKRETQLEDLSDTESAQTDSTCEVNKMSDSDENLPENVMEYSAEETCRKEKKPEMCVYREGSEVLEDVALGMLASDEEIGVLNSKSTSIVSVVGPEKEKEQNGTKLTVPQGMYSKNHFCNITIQDLSDSEVRHVDNNCKARSSLVYKSKMTKEVGSESSETDSDAESRKAIMESAQRRIIQNINTSESESKKFVQPLTESAGSDTSDSVPESMSFCTGRQLVTEAWKNVAESIQRDKHRRKEKRKQRLEKFKQQKEEKLIRLKEKRASQEDASCSSSEESGYEEVDVPSAFCKSNRKEGVKWEKENLDDLLQLKGKQLQSDDEGEPKRMKDKKRKHVQKDTLQHFESLRKLPDDVLENLPDQVPMKLQKTDSEMMSKGKWSHEKCDKYGRVKDKRQAVGFKNQSDIDYIPLSTCGATEFGVMPLDKFMRAPKSMAEHAAEFRREMLFGSRIRRGPAKAQTIYQHKLKASGKDRFFR